MMRRLMTVALACALSFATTGCGDDPSSKASTTPTGSTTETSASPTETPAKQPGPVQVVKAWYRAMNQLIKDGDAADARALITADCWTCDEQIGPPSQVSDADSSTSTSTANDECQELAERYVVDAEEYCSNRDWAPPRAGGQPLTRSAIARAFSTLDLPPSTLVIEPPDGLTLVNFDTNFDVRERVIRRTVTLLGQPVQLRVWAASYTWHFGDGENRTTVEPGAPYPDLRVTHNYLLKDTYRPRVDTTYQAEFRIGQGRWLPVPGTTTVTGTPVRLRAIEATPKLVAPYGRAD